MPNFVPDDRHLPSRGYWNELPAGRFPSATIDAPDTVSFGHIFRVLRSHFLLVIGGAVLGLIGGIYLARQLPHVYRAVATLRLSDARKVLTGGIENAAPTIGRYTDPMQSLVQLVASPQVASQVVDSLGLQLKSATPGFSIGELRDVKVDPHAGGDSIEVKFYQNGVTARLRDKEIRARYGTPLVLGPAQFTVPSPPEVLSATLRVVPHEVAVDGLIGRLNVMLRTGTDLVDVAYQDPNALQAQRVVNTTVQVFQATNIVSSQELSRRRRIFLEGQLRETDSMLAIAQGQLSQFRSQQQVASSADKLTQQQEALFALEGRLAELSADRQAYSALLAKLRSTNEAESAEGLRALAGAPEIASNQLVSSLYHQLLELQTRLDSATTGPWRSAETNPDIVQLRSLIKQNKLNLVAALRSRVTSLDAQIAALRSRRTSGGSSIERLPSLAAMELSLARKVDVLTKNSDQLRQEYHNARMAEVVEAGEVQIINLADIPYLAVWAGGPMRLALGLLIGLMLGSGLAFLVERLNTSIRRPEEVERMVPVPGLAVIPLIAPARRGGGRLAGLLGRGRDSGVAQDGTRALPAPLSTGTEAFRMLRTSLVWSESGESLKTIVVTSAAPSEGKTITAANLAVIFAHEGRRVLLVDCDVRRPKLHTMLRVPRSPGLADLLRSDADMAELSTRTQALETDLPLSPDEVPATDFIRSTGIRGLHLLPCGRIEPTMADLSSAARLRRLLGDLSKWFDVVIMDTPPVLAVADAGILGAMADGVLLVVRAGQTDKTAMFRAHQHLAQIGARVVGTVFNDPEGEVTGEGGYYYPYDYAAQPE